MESMLGRNVAERKEELMAASMAAMREAMRGK